MDTLDQAYQIARGKTLLQVAEGQSHNWFKFGLCGIVSGPLEWDVHLLHKVRINLFLLLLDLRTSLDHNSRAALDSARTSTFWYVLRNLHFFSDANFLWIRSSFFFVVQTPTSDS
jgi:hypothetical protein